MNSPDSVPRVRFAPSPTGHLHVGGARTALFNWLFARRSGGTAILRIEDSDRRRSEAALVEEIVSELRWLGLDWDEGPLFQSERKDVYRAPAERLREEGRVYEQPDPEGKGRALIFRVEGEEKIGFSDLVRGPISFSREEIKDIVLLKSDGSPTYNFACVVDDHEMGISHVLRGEDHISNTPKQLILYQALNWSPPQFAHLPLILGADRSPLSKRHGATSIREFREQGFLPVALLNYLALLGWSPGDDRQFLSVEDLTTSFSLSRVIKPAAVFDYEKLLWLNGKHIQATGLDRLTELVCPFRTAAGGEEVPRQRVRAALKLVGSRLKTLRDLDDYAGYLFAAEVEYHPEAVEAYFGREGLSELIEKTVSRLGSLKSFTAGNAEAAVRALVRERELKGGDLFHPLRVALTGRRSSPPIFEIMEFLGKRVTLARLQRARQFLAGAGKGGGGEDRRNSVSDDESSQ